MALPQTLSVDGTWPGPALVTLLLTGLLAALFPWLSLTSRPAWYLDHLNLLLLGGLTVGFCWERSKRSLAFAFRCFSVAMLLSALRYLPTLLLGTGLPHLPPWTSPIFSTLSLGCMGLGVFALPVEEGLPGDRSRTVLDALLMGVFVFTITWLLLIDLRFHAPSASSVLLQALPLAASIALLAVWVLQESRFLDIATGATLPMLRAGIAFFVLHDLVSALLRAGGWYVGIYAHGTEYLVELAMVCIGLAALAPTDGARRQWRVMTGRWSRMAPGMVATLSILLGPIVLTSLADPKERILWTAALFVMLLLILRQSLLVKDLLNLSKDLERKVAARTRQLELEHGELLRVQRIQLLAGLAAGMAHDLNGLMTVLNLRMDLLAGEHDPKRRDEHLETLRAVVGRASQLTQRILHSRDANTGTPESFDLATWAEAHRGLFQSLLFPGQRMEVETGGAVLVHADPDHLAQVVQNLVTNARDAMSPHGRVVLRIQPLEQSAQCRLVVEDNGPGVDPAIREHIFDPFFTTKPKGKGTGLGLSTVKGLVIQNRGHIRVESEPGQGTQFIVELPAAPA